MNSLSLPVFHPAIQQLKRNGKFFHLLAAGLIIMHAIIHFLQPDRNMFYAVCLILIASDILILILAVRNVLTELPRVNLFFRAVELLFFLGIATQLLFQANWINGSTHMAIAIAFSYLFYCENKAIGEEKVGIHHTGVSIPGFPESRFLKWTDITTMKANYSSLEIDTTFHKSYHFNLQKNLQFDELDQIHEFCRHYLGMRF